MRRLIPAAVLLLAALMVPPLVLAHADLVSAVPADGGTVEGPDVEFVLTFSEALADGSHADVIGPDGNVVITLAPDDASATTMSGAAPLAAGDHTIRWTSVAADGDILRGELRFVVTAAPTDAPTPTPEPSATPAPASPSPTPEASPNPSPSAPPDANGSGESAVIIPIVVALVFVAGAMLWLMRRRPPR